MHPDREFGLEATFIAEHRLQLSESEDLTRAHREPYSPFSSQRNKKKKNEKECKKPTGNTENNKRNIFKIGI